MDVLLSNSQANIYCNLLQRLFLSSVHTKKSCVLGYVSVLWIILIAKHHLGLCGQDVTMIFSLDYLVECLNLMIWNTFLQSLQTPISEALFLSLLSHFTMPSLPRLARRRRCLPQSSGVADGASGAGAPLCRQPTPRSLARSRSSFSFSSFLILLLDYCRGRMTFFFRQPLQSHGIFIHFS